MENNVRRRILVPILASPVRSVYQRRALLKLILLHAVQAINAWLELRKHPMVMLVTSILEHHFAPPSTRMLHLRHAARMLALIVMRRFGGKFEACLRTSPQSLKAHPAMQRK